MDWVRIVEYLIGAGILGVLAYMAKYIVRIPERLEAIENKLALYTAQQELHSEEIKIIKQDQADARLDIAIIKTKLEHSDETK